MKIVVYGTLKNGYGNNVLLRASKFIEPIVIEGYILKNCGFPVAFPSSGDKISGELWDIGDDRGVLANLDRLEAEGRMYNRVEVLPDTFMYVGHPEFWDEGNLPFCPKKQDGSYEWSRF